MPDITGAVDFVVEGKLQKRIEGSGLEEDKTDSGCMTRKDRKINPFGQITNAIGLGLTAKYGKICGYSIEKTVILGGRSHGELSKSFKKRGCKPMQDLTQRESSYPL
jgi:hypothetical protein